MKGSTHLAIVVSVLMLFTILFILSQSTSVADEIRFSVDPIVFDETDNYISLDNNAVIIEFYKGTSGYNKIYDKDGNVVVYDERMYMEYQQNPNTWKQVGIPQSISWVQIDDCTYNVTRFYDNYLGTTYEVIYTIRSNKNIKISLNFTSGSTENYRVAWTPSGINKNYNSYENHSVYFGDIDSMYNWIGFDWTDVNDTFGGISEYTIETVANGKKANIYFNVGEISVGDTLFLDPSISYGSEYVFNSVTTDYISVSSLDSTHFVVSYRNVYPSSGAACIGTVSGSTISYGSEYVFNSASAYQVSVSSLDSTHFVVSYRDGGNSNYGTSIIGTVSGSTISYGSEYVFNSASIDYISASSLNSTHFVVSYRDGGNSNYGTSIIGTVSGSTISYGSEYVFNSASIDYISASSLNSTHFVVSYRDGGNSNYGTSIIGTVSGSTISYGSEYVFNSASAYHISVFSLDSTHFVISYSDGGTSNYGTSIIGTVSGSTISYGSEYIFNSASTAEISVSSLNSTHFVVSYRDTGNSNYGTSIIGTVSGSTISYDSEYIFNSASTSHISVSSMASSYFITSYADDENSNYGTSIVGIILGVPTAFTATTTGSTQINLLWTKGSNANGTIIERNTVSSWVRGVGTEIYNNTGTSYSDTARSPGTTYYYQAWSYVISEGSYYYPSSYVSSTNLTYPNAPSSFMATGHTKSTIDFSWTKGTGADYTVIRYSTTGYPATQYSGIFAYNETGLSTQVSGLSNGQIYYFRAWSHVSESGKNYFSESYASTTEYTNPSDPLSLNAFNPTYNSINLTWTKGTGADTTVVRGKLDSYPSTYSSDVAVYSGTNALTTHSVSPEQQWFYRAWMYDTESGYYSESYSQDYETSLPGNPSITTGSTTGVTDVNTTLHGNLVDLGNTGSVTVYFQYGETESFGDTSSSLVRGATGSFSINILSLSGDTLYYYRAVAVGDGTGYGSTDSFITGTTPPTVTTNTATNVDTTSATLRGTLGTMGTASSVQALFEYGETEAYGYETSPDTLTATGTFSKTVSGLNDDTLYHFRAKAIGDGTVYGSDQTFTTVKIEIVPTVVTGASTDVAVTSATLNANLLDLGSADPVSVYFQYGVTPSFESTTSSQSFSASTPFSSSASDLSPDTIYYYRAVAVGDGTVYGSTNSFTTGTTPPTITTGMVTNVLQRGATLYGTLSSMGTASSVQVLFEYGETEAYGSVSSITILTGTGDYLIDVTSLSTSTLYHFRAKAIGDGTAYGLDGEFTTLGSTGGTGGGTGGGGLPTMMPVTVTLTVYVEDQYGRPLQNAFVIIFQPISTLSTGITVAEELGTTVAYEYTNVEGIATFELSKGTYTIQIERQGYSTETRTVSLLADMSVSDIELNPTSVSVFGISSWVIMLSFGVILLIISFLFRKNLNISGWGKPKNMFGASKPGSWTFSEKTTQTVLFGIAGVLLVILIIFIIPNIPALEQMAIYYVLIGVISLFCIAIESIQPKFGIATIGFGKLSNVTGNILLGLAFASIFVGLTGFISQFQLLDIPLISTESLIMLLMVAGVASFFEEIFFAGVLTPTLAEKLGIVSSIILVSIIFMFGHGLTYGWALIPLFNALIFRAIATVTVLHRKSWLPALVAHTFINFLSILTFVMVV